MHDFHKVRCGAVRFNPLRTGSAYLGTKYSEFMWDNVFSSEWVNSFGPALFGKKNGQKPHGTAQQRKTPTFKGPEASIYTVCLDS